MQIVLTEGQYKRLFEARIDGFRVDYLRSCNSYDERVKYCKKMLGFPIGKGSSRMVFQLDDETCLKLAINEKGIAQNLEEIKIARDGFISYIPKIYNGSDEEDGLWVITQYVLPAKKTDFKNCREQDTSQCSSYKLESKAFQCCYSNYTRSYDDKSYYDYSCDVMLNPLQLALDEIKTENGKLMFKEYYGFNV